MCCVCESNAWACHIAVGLGKQPEFHEPEDETSVHEISMEGVQDFLLVAEPSSLLILAEVQILQCCWGIWARESKHFEEVRLWYWNLWGSTYLGGVRLFQYCSEQFDLAATYFEIFGMGAVVWLVRAWKPDESTGILPCRDPQWVVGNCNRFIYINPWDTCIRPRISRSSGRSLEITCCLDKIPLFCPVHMHSCWYSHLEVGHWTTHPPPSLLAM